MPDASEPWPLPDAANWRFDEISAAEPARAKQLEQAASPEALVAAIASALQRALQNQECRYAWEFADDTPSDHRAVVQFRVQPDVFDWFFNGRTGYRAHFRPHPQKGLQFNAVAVDALHHVLGQHLPATLDLPKVDSSMASSGAARVRRDDFLASLDADLSKVWFGVRPIGGGQERLIGFIPRLQVSGMSWGAPMMNDAWLDLKGAFSDGRRLYQPKTPEVRADLLHQEGRA